MMDTPIFKTIEQYIKWVDLHVYSDLHVETEVIMVEIPCDRYYVVNVQLFFTDYDCWDDDAFIQIQCDTFEKAIRMQKYVEMIVK